MLDDESIHLACNLDGSLGICRFQITFTLLSLLKSQKNYANFDKIRFRLFHNDVGFNLTAGATTSSGCSACSAGTYSSKDGQFSI